MNGKSKCKILKDIRRQIAAQNNIAYVTSECKFQGNCSGTCPKCEAEVRYLEEELRKRRQAGKTVAVAGIAAALVVTASGCMPVQTGGDPLPPNTTYSQQVDGELVSPTESTEDLFMGVPETVPSQTETTSPEDLMGDPVPDTTEDLWEGEIVEQGKIEIDGE